MLRRLVLGLVKGAVLGGLLAALLVKGAGLLVVPSALLVYAMAAGTGALAGLFTGKPVWAKDGRVEASLKALFGAVLGLGAAFGLRGWLNYPIDLSAFGLGAGSLSTLSVTLVPAITTLLALIFELDNDGTGATKTRVEAPKQRIRDASAADIAEVGLSEAELEALEQEPRAKTRR